MYKCGFVYDACSFLSSGVSARLGPLLRLERVRKVVELLGVLDHAILQKVASKSVSASEDLSPHRPGRGSRLTLSLANPAEQSVSCLDESERTSQSRCQISFPPPCGAGPIGPTLPECPGIL